MKEKKSTVKKQHLENLRVNTTASARHPAEVASLEQRFSLVIAMFIITATEILKKK